MNFEQKLNIILELFDVAYSKDAMDDVKKIEHRDRTSYLFKDLKAGSDSYEVAVIRHSIPSFWPIVNKIPDISLPGIITDSYCEITLSLAGQYGLTGIGNANYVYGKMLACLFDYVEHQGLPALIYFTNYDPKTYTTYQRLINKVAKTKGFKYEPCIKHMFVLDNIAKMLDFEDKKENTEVRDNKLSSLADKVYSTGVKLHSKNFI